MTKSTGVRERQRRREELFAAELRLGRVLLHLLASHSWARQCCRSEERNPSALAEYLGIDAAFQVVRGRLYRVRAEVRSLG